VVIQRLSGSIGGKSLIFGIIHAASADFGAIVIAMNFAMALMFVGSQPLEDNVGGCRMFWW
jgi:hypothetical protein